MSNFPGVCDFCSDPNPIWAYGAKDFVMLEMTEHRSAGGWAACDACRETIELGGLEALITRATRGYLASRMNELSGVGRDKRREVKKQIEIHLRAMFTEFFSARTGPPMLLKDIGRECTHPRTVFTEHGEGSFFLPTGHYCTACGACVALGAEGELIPVDRA